MNILVDHLHLATWMQQNHLLMLLIGGTGSRVRPASRILNLVHASGRSLQCPSCQLDSTRWARHATPSSRLAFGLYAGQGHQFFHRALSWPGRLFCKLVKRKVADKLRDTPTNPSPKKNCALSRSPHDGFKGQIIPELFVNAPAECRLKIRSQFNI